MKNYKQSNEGNFARTKNDSKTYSTPLGGSAETSISKVTESLLIRPLAGSRTYLK